MSAERIAALLSKPVNAGSWAAIEVLLGNMGKKVDDSHVTHYVGHGNIGCLATCEKVSFVNWNEIGEGVSRNGDLSGWWVMRLSSLVGKMIQVEYFPIMNIISVQQYILKIGMRGTALEVELLMIAAVEEIENCNRAYTRYKE